MLRKRPQTEDSTTTAERPTPDRNRPEDERRLASGGILNVTTRTDSHHQLRSPHHGAATVGGAQTERAEDAPAPAIVAPPLETDDVEVAPPRGRFSLRTFDSLKDSAFRWFFLAMLGQMASMNMQLLVRGYLVFELTGSYAALGVISLASAIPMILFSLPGGVMADRVREKKHVIQVGQLLNAANALAVAVLLVLDLLRFEHLFIASLVQGSVLALAMPSRQSLIPQIVGMDRLMNAVALNAAGMNSMRLLAPAAGGFLIALLGPQWIYFLMCGLYLWASAFLLKVPDYGSTSTSANRPRVRGMSDVLDGVRYIVHDPVLRAVLSLNVLLILLSMPYIFLLPGFVDGVLNEGPAKLGLLMAITGAGSLVGALVIASLPPRRRGLLFILTSMLQGVALIAFSASVWFWVTAPIMFVMGIGQAGRQSFSNVLVQSYVEDNYRGRVMSIYMLQFGLTSLGTFVVGVLAAVIGPQLALGGAAALMVAVTGGALLFSPRVRDLA